MLGTRVIIETLKREGVDLAFAYPGGQITPLFDEFYDERDIRLILPRHEQAGAHAADGYARATGKVGVVITTSGPGATNLATGIANAHLDSVPLVAITGQVPSPLIGNDAFQEVDVVGITRSISKHNYLVSSPGDLAFMLRAAFHIARSGRPGPVVVDIPSDVQRAEIARPIPDKIVLPSYQPNYEGNPRQIERIAGLINAASRPLLYVGGGVVGSEAADDLRLTAATAGLPAVASLMALGTLPFDDPLFLGMPGMHGTPAANRAIMNCDLLIAVGTRFDDRVTGKTESFAPLAKIIHIDVDPTSVAKNVRADLPVIGDAGNILRRLVPQLKKRERREWLEEIALWREESAALLGRQAASGLSAPRVVREMARLSRDLQPILVTDVGQHQMWAALHWEHRRPRGFISSGGLGTMGFGLPAAVGAQLGRPDSLVFCLSGDGGLQMNIQELCTVRRLDLPIKIVVINNGCLGMVRQWQEFFWGRRYSHVDLDDNPDFGRIAEAYGLRALAVNDGEGVSPALEEAIRHPGPVLVDVRVGKGDNVFPMVPPGEGLDRILLSAPPAAEGESASREAGAG
ncbi:MAG: biosynthetic-type acetolactate synthase large subunit [Planctomycetota bacterium]|jgi:acetolactate synthase-1/2/3 large subunit|nr:biosynthetic-type acetolactate synthase large subunit [Planctomycetota bacterium]